MTSLSLTARPAARRAGTVLTGLVATFLTVVVLSKLLNPAFVQAAMEGIGWPPTISPVLGVILGACTALYVAPPTARLGALLLTGYFGGAVAASVRVGAPLFSQVLVPLYVAVFVWAALALRDPVVRAFFLPRRQP